MANEELMVGIDIGSSRIAVVVGEKGEDYDGNPVLSIIGAGEAVSDGVRDGIIVNIEKTVSRIKEAVKSAEEMSDCDIEVMNCGIGGIHIRGFNSPGVAPVTGGKSGTEREVSKNDMKAACNSAAAVSLNNGEMQLCTIPLYYKLDGNDCRILEPENMLCSRLEAEVHIITAKESAVKNLTHSITKAGYTIKAKAPSVLATCMAVFSEEEKKGGILLVDIGADVTSFAVSVDNVPYCTAAVGMGSRYITSDISKVLGIPLNIAEEIKKNDGICHEIYLQEGKEIVLPISCGVLADKAIKCSEVCEIIQARLWEIFMEIGSILETENQLENINGGIIFTGGGSLVPGICELAYECFGIQARVGLPIGFEDHTGGRVNSPGYAVALGLVKGEYDNLVSSGQEQKKIKNPIRLKKKEKTPKEGKKNLVKEFLKGFFTED